MKKIQRILYTNQKIQRILKDLKIQPDTNGCINAQEVADILTWRALAEYGVVHTYEIDSVGRIARSGALRVAKNVSPRCKLYAPEDVVKVPITPSRGRKKEEMITQVQAASLL